MNDQPTVASRVGNVLIASALLLGTTAQISVAARPGPMAQSATSEETRPPQEGRKHGRGHRHHIDLTTAAAELGTTEPELREALGLPENPEAHGRERFEAAAIQLGVSEADLREALGITLDPETGRLMRPQTRPDLGAAAARLDVTEAELRDAFGGRGGGQHGQRPQLDVAGAAEAFGVSEAELTELLGIQNRPSGPRTGSRRL
ncbi:MAG: hypothetical protein WBA10_06060 [Elainellaceae cyanobacterium]